MATEEEIVHKNVCAIVLKKVGIRHPIVFNTFNLCDMHKTGKLQLLSVSMLRSICEHFDIEVMNIKGRHKASYLSLLGELLVYRLIKLTFQPQHSSISRLKKKTDEWRENRPTTFINFVYSYCSIEHYA